MEENGRGRERVMAPVVGGRKRSKKTLFLGGRGTRWKDRGVYSERRNREREERTRKVRESEKEREKGEEKERGIPRENVSWWLPTCTPLPLSPVVTFLANAARSDSRAKPRYHVAETRSM